MKWIKNMLLLFLIGIAVTACLASPGVIEHSPYHATVDDPPATEVAPTISVVSNFLYDVCEAENNTLNKQITPCVVSISALCIESEAVTIVNETVLRTPIPPDIDITNKCVYNGSSAITYKEILVQIRDKLSKPLYT